MRILVLADRFIPEISATSFRLGYYAKSWCAAGHEVTVVTCAPNLPRGKVFSGYKNGLYRAEWIDGVRVVRVWSYITANAGFARRILDQSSFMVSAVLQSWRFPKFDVIFASSPPLFVAMAGYMISRVWRRPWIFELADLWPASIEAVGLGKKAPMWLLEKIELFLYRNADRIISLTPAFKENLARRGISPDKNDVITNGVDTEKFDPAIVREDIRKELGISENVFLVGYFGTTGMAHGLDTFLEAARRHEENKSIMFLIIGDGAEREALEEKSHALGLTSIIFRNFVAHEKMPDYLAALDLFLVHLKPHPVFKTVIPSKIFEPMAMEIPMLCALEGEGARVVSESGAGMCIPPGDPTIMADTIFRFSKERFELAQMGKNGRQAAIEKFSRRSKADAVLKSFKLTLKLRCDITNS
jgi:colanic acid biosynthesis glycosyl transferase WcaI